MNMFIAIIKKIAVSIKAFLEKIRKIFATKKKAAIGVIAVLVLIITFLQGIDWLKEKVIDGEIVFKTMQVSPDVNKDNYDLVILPGAQVVPIVNPVLEGEQPEEASGPRYNIIFTLTNKAKQELLVDEVEAYLINFQRLPEKYIVTMGPHAVLRPIDLYLNLNSSQISYEMLKGRYLSIESGRTEHVFTVWVSGKEPGIYQFKLRMKGREGGNKERVIESDKIYTFAVPDYEDSPPCMFLYSDRTKEDPNFQELFQIVDKPKVEFEEITLSWGEYKLIDGLQNMPMSLLDFMGKNMNKEYTGTYEQGGAPISKKASEIALSEYDLKSFFGRFKDNSGKPIPMTVKMEDLPYWFVNSYKDKVQNTSVSAKTIKLTGEAFGFDVVYNTVAVYPTIESARKAFNDTIPSDDKVDRIFNVDIGDDGYLGFFNHGRVLVFRRSNVVVMVVGMIDLPFFEEYGGIIDRKILN
ncbi:hypothetical protein ACFLXD_05350 [Chloroflexota bacterium]